MTDMATLVAHADGRNGQLDVFRDHIRIRREGVMALLTQGMKGSKEIMISQISAIQFRPATFWTLGYIQFSFIGGQEAKGGLIEAGSDENSIQFKRDQQSD